MSPLDWSLFDPELLARNIAMREADPDSEIPLHPNRCGPCEDCAELLSARARTYWDTVPGLRAPTTAELVRARRKYAEGTKPTRRRRTTTPLRRQVLDLHTRGVVVTAIADVLEISDRRVKEIVRGAGKRRNGHRKPFIQAENFADKRPPHVPTWVGA